MCPCAPHPPKTKEKQERNDKITHEAVVMVFGEPMKSWSMDKSSLLLNSWENISACTQYMLARNTFLILNTYQDRVLASSALTFPTMVAGSATKLVAWVS
jgi:hypothetical protein